MGVKEGSPERRCTDFEYTLWFKKNAPTLADYNYNPVQSILIIFSNLFANDQKLSGGKIFHLTAHMLPLYLVKHNALFCTNYTAYRKKMRQLRITITSISVKEF